MNKKDLINLWNYLKENQDIDLEDEVIDEAEDTVTILSKYVNSLNIDDKKELDNLLVSLYNESLTIETI